MNSANPEAVGGKIVELAISHLKHGSQIVLCSNVSVYNDHDAKGLRVS
jgi:NADPH-dependent curcumin reductase CurA